MIKLYYYFLLIRPLNVFVSALAMIISAAILNRLNESLTIALVTLVVMVFTAAANSINDVIDLETDKINRPLRPIPSKNINKNRALLFSFILFLIGSILCLQLSISAQFIGIIIAMPLMIVYSTDLKSKPLIGNIAVSVIIGLSFVFCGAAFGDTAPMWTPGLLAFGLTLIREITKDIADFDGDRFAKHNTYPIKYGIKSAVKLIVIFSCSICLFSLLPYFSNTYNFWYLIILVIGVELPLIVVVFLLVNNPSISSAIYSSKILKLSTIMGLAAIYIGSLK